ncbi:MAG: hypothetical protein GVY36_04685 [Verrucomicrobia bacterium]|nr:hypothetical protein [Verrucomicrobiota bacterium]
MHYADKQLYAWSDHWARLSQSAATFGLALPAEAEVIQALKTLVTQSELAESTLKLSLLKGAADSHLFVYARPPLPSPESRCLRLDRDAPIFERSRLAGHKTHNYMEAMHRLELARADGYYDALRLDSLGRLAETTTANIFFILDERLCTPASDTGILPGVTRALLLRSAKLQAETGHYTLEDLEHADALFVTNATNGIRVMDSVEGLPGPSRVEFDPAHPVLETIRAVHAASRRGIRLR